jgi:hypothetical protein
MARISAKIMNKEVRLGFTSFLRGDQEATTRPLSQRRSRSHHKPTFSEEIKKPPQKLPCSEL